MRSELEIIRMQFGSQVYGTSTPESDTDYKAIFLPSGRDILLGQAPKTSRTTSTGDPHGKNTNQDVDIESFTLQGYLKLLLDGQTVTTDMLFVPIEFWSFPHHPIWLTIVENRNRLISRNIKGFLGYCKSQAAKYGIKGSRMAAAESSRNLFREINSRPRMTRDIPRVAEFEKELQVFANETDHVDIIEIPQPEGRPGVKHLEVCGKKVAWTTSTRRAEEAYTTLFDRYGQRARDAKNNENIDWKAMMHAVRIGEQAIELLNTGHITFPRPNASNLLQIRQGMLPYHQVAERLEDLLEQVEVAADGSHLSEKPSRAFSDNLVLEAYREQVSGRTDC